MTRASGSFEYCASRPCEERHEAHGASRSCPASQRRGCSGTAAAARRASSRRCSSPRRPPPARGAWPKAPPSATSTTTSSAAACRISASLCHLTWNGVKVNLLDTPGEPSFQGDTLAALRAVDAVLMVVNAASGVEVQTERLWNRAAEAGLARAIAVNMLDRERADFDEVMGAIAELAPGRGPDPDPDRQRGRLRGRGEPGLDDGDDLRRRDSPRHHRADPGRACGRRPVGPRAPDRRGGREGRRPHREVPRGRGDHHRRADRRDPDRRRRGPGRTRWRASPATTASASTACSTCWSRRCRRRRPWQPGRPSTADGRGPRWCSPRTAPSWRSASRRSPTSSAGASACCACSPACCRPTASSRPGPAARSGWASSSPSRARTTSSSPRSAPATSVQSPS